MNTYNLSKDTIADSMNNSTDKIKSLLAEKFNNQLNVTPKKHNTNLSISILSVEVL